MPRLRRFLAKWRSAAVIATTLSLAVCDDDGEQSDEGGGEEECSNGPGYHGATYILSEIVPDPGGIPIGVPLECTLGGMTAGFPEIGYTTTWPVYGPGLMPKWTFGLGLNREDTFTGSKTIQQLNTGKIGDVTLLLGVPGDDGMIVPALPVEPNPGSFVVNRHDGMPGGLVEGEFAGVQFRDNLDPPHDYLVSGSFSLTIPMSSGGS
jgi:hypothetical protein